MTMRLATDLFECTWAFQQIRFVGFLSFGSTCSEVYRILETFEFCDSIWYSRSKEFSNQNFESKVQRGTLCSRLWIWNWFTKSSSFSLVQLCTLKSYMECTKGGNGGGVNFQWFTRSRYMGWIQVSSQLIYNTACLRSSCTCNFVTLTTATWTLQ